ncbi:hypothetical protein LXA43DRAFT_1057622 [Ganoderma leucocontextum]|nr:hypothetical protein LXA43DRAFT_1057622 [Ganoderma leucocontextum]
MYHHNVHSHLFDPSQNIHPNPHPQHSNPDYDPHSRQQPPSIHTDNLLYSTDPGTFTPSPISSPTDNTAASQATLTRQFSFPQPMSAPHTQTAFPQRFPNEQGLSRIPFTNPTLDRRMSEPVLGAGRQTFAQPPPSQHDTFAYSAASSATIVQSSPLSPRPSSSYSSYGTYTEHQRDSSGASIGSTGLSDPYANPVAAWGSGLKQAELEAEAHLASSPLSPMYAGSAASGSDVSATGFPSPPAQLLQSPSKNAALPPGGGAKPQHGAPGQASAGSTPRPGGNNSKTYSFVSLPGNAVKKRPRRRYDEIERLYQCSWPNCAKAYGTLNHLNAHVTMQRHGSKRSPNEFKELRKKWRQEKKEAEEADRERERESAAQAMAMRDLQYHHPHQPMAYDDHRFAPRRRVSMVEPYPDPHGHGPPGGPHSLPNHSYMHSAMQGQGAGAVQTFGNPPQPGPSYGSLQGAGMGMDARYGLPSPADEVAHFRYPSGHHPSQGLPSLSIPHHNPEEDMYYRQGQMTPQGELVGPGWGNQHPSQHPHHGMRPLHQQQFYSAQGNITLPPPHSMNPLSVSAPNPSPLSGGGFPPLGPSSGPGPTLGGDVGLGMAGAGQESSSPTPELSTHVSLGSNRLPPDSTLLTPLPGYEPDSEQIDMGRPRERSRERELERDYDRDRVWVDRAVRDRERYYAGNGQGNGREQQYE